MVAPRSALADRSNRPTASADESAKASGTYVQENSSVDVHLAGQYAMCKKYAFYSSKWIRPYSTRTLPHPYVPYSTSPEGCAG